MSRLENILGNDLAHELMREIVSKIDRNLDGNQVVSGPCSWMSPQAFQRIAALLGTAHVADGSDWVASGGFGTGAVVLPTPGSNDTRGQLTVTAGSAAFGASPTLTLTFKDGAFLIAPIVLVSRGTDTNQPTVGLTVTATTTGLAITFLGTPDVAEVYTINYLVIG